MPAIFDSEKTDDGTQPFLWLHIKKAGGQSMRQALGGNYRQTDRRIPTPFVALPRQEWNDALNDYRMRLGQYDFRRMLFAKRFLYPEDFEERFKFAIVRNPYARAVSCWRYATRRWGFSCRAKQMLARRSFAYFLTMLPDLWNRKWNREAATHTAPMWPDITDEEDRLLLDHIGHLETIKTDFELIANTLGLPPSDSFPTVNAQQKPASYRHFYSRRTRKLVEELYGADIEQLGYDF